MPDLLAPLRALVTLVLATDHSLVLTAGLPEGGVAWLLAVALLVVLVRLLLLPLAILQMRTGARLRALAPELRRIRDRHGTGPAAREAVARETAALYRERGVRPLASVAPLLVQAPVFLALVQALEQAVRGAGGAAMTSFAVAAVLGAPLAVTALSGGWPSLLVGGALLAVTAGAQVLAQHLGGGGQSSWLLVVPVLTAASGLLLPIGVTAYWCSSALWTLGQQAVLGRMLRLA